MRKKEFERHTLAVGLSVTLVDLKKAEQEGGRVERADNYVIRAGKLRHHVIAASNGIELELS